MNFLEAIQINDSWIITGIVYALIAVGGTLLFRNFQKISIFIAEVKGELRKASWPWSSDAKITGFKKYKELIDSTIVVLVAMILLAGFVQFWDYLQILVVGFLNELAR